MTEETEEEEEVSTEDEAVPVTSWEFLEPPTVEQVMEKLDGLHSVWKLEWPTYIDYVQPLPQRKNIALDSQQKDYRNVWTLYVTVAGRQAMLNDLAYKNVWRVDIIPEPSVPPGHPAGYLQFDEDRIVYREYVEIHEIRTVNGEQIEVFRGRKPGTAWVPSSGGAGAIASNRFEKVETAARGRAIAAWGIGVLPGSGVASLDEMQSASQIRQNDRGARGSRRQAPQQRTESREDVEASLRSSLAEYAQVTGLSDEAVDIKCQQFVKRSYDKELGHKQVEGDEPGPLDFSVLKDGELVLFRNRMAGEVRKEKSERSDL